MTSVSVRIRRCQELCGCPGPSSRPARLPAPLLCRRRHRNQGYSSHPSLKIRRRSRTAATSTRQASRPWPATHLSAERTSSPPRPGRRKGRKHRRSLLSCRNPAPCSGRMNLFAEYSRAGFRIWPRLSGICSQGPGEGRYRRRRSRCLQGRAKSPRRRAQGHPA